jgi:hypothetical protein
MNKEENNILSKKDFEEILSKAIEEQTQSIIEATNLGFEKAKEDRNEIKNKLSGLERVALLDKKVSQLEVGAA